MKKIFLLLLAFTLLGLVSSILMTQLHYKIGAAGLEERSFCHVSEFFDCDAALASRYSKIQTRFGTFLNSELGILYYLLVGCGLLYAWFSEKRESTLAFLFISSLFALLYSILMAYLSFVKLGILCPLCTGMYVASLLSVLIFPRALGIGYCGVPKFLVHYVRSVFGGGALKTRLGFHLGAVAAVLLGGIVFFKGLSPSIHKARAEVPREAYLKVFYSLPQFDIPLSDRPFWGNKEAKVTIVEFSDFQCPFCRKAAFTLKAYLKEYRDQIRFFYLNFPLDSSCNPAIGGGMHPSACLAAKASLCAHREGKFWDYHDRVFENQKKLSRETLLRIAAEIGLERSKFEACVISDETSRLLKEDTDAGVSVEVRGTPAVFINGRYFRDWLQPERLRMVIESEIAKKM